MGLSLLAVLCMISHQGFVAVNGWTTPNSRDLSSYVSDMQTTGKPVAEDKTSLYRCDKPHPGCSCVRNWHPSSSGYLSVSCRNASLGKLSRLEDISPGVKLLQVERDHLPTLMANNTPSFVNLTSIHLVRCNIARIDPGVFDKYPKLQRVDLSRNPLAVKGLDNLFNICYSLRKMPITHLMLSYVTYQSTVNVTQLNTLFKLLSNTKLKYLDFSYNRMPRLPDELFTPLKSLEYLDILSCSREYQMNIKAFRGLHNLTLLQLQYNNMLYFPVWIDSDYNNLSILPNLKSLHVDFNIFESIPPSSFAGLEGLERLTMDQNSNGLKHVFTNNFQLLPNLKELSLAWNRLQIMDKGALNISTLEILDLTGSSFMFYQMPNDILSYLPKLKSLCLSAVTNLQHGSTEIKEMISNLYNLEYLQIQSLELEYLHPDTFANMSSLKHLSLTHNRLQALDPGLFRNNDKLEELMLGGNQLVTISHETFPTEILNNLTVLDISNNPLMCNCDLSWFRMVWMEAPWGRVGGKMKDKLHMDLVANDTTCESPMKFHGQNLEYFHINHKKCSSKPLPVEFYISLFASAAIFLTASAFSVAYKYQWHLKYWCYNLKAKYRARAKADEDYCHYQWDVFVCYCSADVQWVKEYLIPFEKKHGLKFCLHERNWIAGKLITDNAIQSIMTSRKIILVISNAFARSQWCQFEMEMIQFNLLNKDKDNVILIVKEDIHAFNMTPRLVWHMKNKTYIEWPEIKSVPKAKSITNTDHECSHNTDNDYQMSQEPLIGAAARPQMQDTHQNKMAEKLFWEQLEEALVRPSTSHLHAPVDRNLSVIDP